MTENLIIRKNDRSATCFVFVSHEETTLGKKAYAALTKNGYKTTLVSLNLKGTSLYPGFVVDASKEDLSQIIAKIRSSQGKDGLIDCSEIIKLG